ncbi:MAG TPA: LacI family DNA-binding transcriptional regulator [Actinocrinis sp.]|nr:LacI family DNA-binding transcriptional regulator [Actinocrinis sp.]
MSAPTRRATMNDVAAHAGVSLKTVSRVVNGDAAVIEETRTRVQRSIEQLGFRRNDSARQLRTGRTAGIGLILEDVADPFYSTLTRAVEQVATAHDCLLFTGSCDDDPGQEQKLALALCARRVDGLLIVPAAADHAYLAPELAAGLPAVFIDRPPVNLAADMVLTDNAGGAVSGISHLIQAGHQRIGYLGDTPTIHTAAERLTGYRAAMAAHGLPIDERWVSMGRLDQEQLRAELVRLLTGPDRVTALFTGNNRLTVSVLRELAHLPVGDGMAAAVATAAAAAGNGSRAGHAALTTWPALVGFDDFELADLVVPGVTVVAQDPAGLGRMAAELLFDRLAGLSDPPRRLILPTTLIARGSGEVAPR